MDRVIAALYEYLMRNNLKVGNYKVTISGPAPDIHWLEAAMKRDFNPYMGREPVSFDDAIISGIKFQLKAEGEGYTYRGGPMDYRS